MVILAVTVAGCGKPSSKPVTEQLQQSFEKADGAIKQDIDQAKTAFQAGDYTRAITVMDQVVQTQPIDEAQKRAVEALIVQTQKAAEKNPKLATRELYKATSDLVQRMYPEK